MSAKRPKFKPVKPEQLDVVVCKQYFGGTFPNKKGKKYRYPKPENERGWVCLIAKALTYKNRCTYHYKNGLPPPEDRNKQKYAYVLYHGRPEQIQRRAKRNKDRREFIKNGKLGKKENEVHHTDRDTMDSRTAVALTPAQHKCVHGQKKSVKECMKVKGKGKGNGRKK